MGPESAGSVPIQALIASLAVFALNVPFGLWRARSRKFSLPWFLAIHVPVPLVVAVRIVSGIGFRPYTYPVLVGAFFLGQWVGGRIRRRLP